MALMVMVAAVRIVVIRMRVRMVIKVLMDDDGYYSHGQVEGEQDHLIYSIVDMFVPGKKKKKKKKQTSRCISLPGLLALSRCISRLTSC
jgi:hypothetical protein